MVAKCDVALHLLQPAVDVNAHPLMPDEDDGVIFCPHAEWAKGYCAPEGASVKPRLDGCTKNHQFLAASAIAFLGRVTSSARVGMTFRDVSFINNVLWWMMLPEAIARESLLRRNRAMRRSIADIVAEYNKKHPESRRHGHKRAVTTTENIDV